MARRSLAYRERTFDPAQKVYVRKPFNGNGRRWERGQEYPWQHMAISSRRVRQMFDAGRLRHAEASDDRVDTAMHTMHTTVATDAGPVDVQKPDELDDIADMRELRAIALTEGAKTTTSKTLQRKYIRENRHTLAGGPVDSETSE